MQNIVNVELEGGSPLCQRRSLELDVLTCVWCVGGLCSLRYWRQKEEQSINGLLRFAARVLDWRVKSKRLNKHKIQKC